MSEHTDTVLLEDEFLAAALELQAISAQEKLLADRKEEAKRIIEKLLSAGERGVTADGTALVAVRNGAARFKPELAQKNLPANIVASLEVITIDAKRAKAILAPALYERCVEYNKPSVVAL